MKTVREETTSEIAGSRSANVAPRITRLEPLLEPRLEPRQNPQVEPAIESRGSDRHIHFLNLSTPRMDLRGWRRPSAPSVFHHIESAFSRRLSSTPPTAAPAAPAGLSPAPAPLTGPQHCNAVALRRPSAVVIVTPNDEERRLVDSPELQRDGSCSPLMPMYEQDDYLKDTPKFNDTITVYLSAMYAKLLVILGIAFPLCETISDDDKRYQGFYLYLYSGTFFFLSFMYGNVLKKRAIVFVVNTYRRKGSQPRPSMDASALGAAGSQKHYGSFYLRLGAIAFGIGSMVYSGLEFGQFFELRPDCRRVTQALTPAARMVLTLVQMQFIFLNNREMDMMRHKVLGQFGLMHMVATNLCEWLTVIIEEAKHEIEHMADEHHGSQNGSHGGEVHVRAARGAHATLGACFTSDILGTLVRNASPFLFPCTIEYSLICAVVLFEMWKNAHKHGSGQPHARSHSAGLLDLVHGRSAHHLSVDCTKAHKGLFAGIVVVVLTIISLILFFVLNEAPGFKAVGMLVVSVCELTLYIVTTLAVLGAFYQIRSLKYLSKGGGLGLDNTLLVMAQTGVFMYNIFCVLAYSFTRSMPRSLVSELCGLLQTICQTIFVLDATQRRCSSPRECRRKPGRQMVTFLLVSNMAMWIVNTLEKSRARSRPILLSFYGTWPWTLIVHISMPLAIFYRFHSTICLFEIWKGCYKLKQNSARHRHLDAGGHGANG